MGLSWVIGVVAIVLGLLAFIYSLAKVRRGMESSSVLVEETLHDLALVALGVALILGRSSAARPLLLGAFVVFFLGYLGRKLWRRQHRG